MRENDPMSFFYKYFRMTPEQFYYLLFLVSLLLTVNFSPSLSVWDPNIWQSYHMTKSGYMIGRILQKTRWSHKI